MRWKAVAGKGDMIDRRSPIRGKHVGPHMEDVFEGGNPILEALFRWALAQQALPSKPMKPVKFPPDSPLGRLQRGR